MKVLLINCVSDTPETHLYRGLHAAGIELSLILDPRDSAAESLQEGGIPVFQKSIRHRFDFGFDRFLEEHIAEFTPDVIHAPTSRGVASALRVTKGSNIKVLTYRGTLGNLSRLSIPARLAHLHPRVAGIFCNCKAVQGYMHGLGVELSRLPLVYKGHDASWYQSESVHSRDAFGFSDDTFVIGCFANIRPLKGVDVLVRAVEMLQNLNRPVHLLLVGDARDTKLQEYVSRNGLTDMVTFLGFRKDVPSLLPLCDVTVMPSLRREGFPRAIVESYSNAIPVVCTSVGGMPEIVIDRETGLVVPPGDVDALAAALRRVSEEREHWQEAGQKGRERIADLLSLERYVQNTIAAYTAVVSSD